MNSKQVLSHFSAVSGHDFAPGDLHAKAEYRLELTPGSDLRNVLNRLYGKQVFANVSNGQFDLEQLVNMDCEVEIEHVVTSRRDEYSYPLVRVRDIRKPGTMQLTSATPEDPNYACH